MARREYRSGSVYQRASDGRWVGTIEAGWTPEGTRRRIVVTAKSEGLCKRKLRDRQKQVAINGAPAASPRTTVKAWAEQWLEVKRTELRPKAYNAASSAVNRWIIPTIGHIRLEALTPTHLKTLEKAQRDAGRKGTTAAATHRTALNLLRAAVREGHTVREGVLISQGPKTAKSDRAAIPLMDALQVMAVASTLPHGTRWLVAMLHGMRQGECLGTTWEAIDFERGTLAVEWQLQAIPWVDRKDKSKGFRVPVDYEARHLVDSWHLVRPKSKQGVRVFPLIEPLRDALLSWQQVAPANPWGLVWPTIEGRPANNKHDDLEWHALQGTACVGHPAGRYYHVHEARNLAATEMRQLGASDAVLESLMGHASIVTSRGYMTAHLDAKRVVLEAFGERLLPALG